MLAIFFRQKQQGKHAESNKTREEEVGKEVEDNL